MPSSPGEPLDLLDLKLLPAWVKESPDARRYANHAGDEGGERFHERDSRGRRGPGRGDKPRTRNFQPGAPGAASRNRQPERKRRDQRPGRGRDRHERGRDGGAPREDRDRQEQDQLQRAAAQIDVRFVPHPPAFDNVAAQIKSSSLAYSVFSLARLFLEKPERYDVHLAAKPGVSLYQLGENGVISWDRHFLENNAFRFAQGDFYKIDLTQGEPVKGNFTSVARCRLSGTLFGPTNHHAYQPKLRSLYEQRFSRRMSFPEYQRQVEIVTDPALVEQWKEEARTITTLTTLREEAPVTFATAADAERHFRQNYFPDLVQTVSEAIIDGVSSRKLPDRMLRRLVEDAWSIETRSPSKMMPELSNRLRESGLHIFRHRRGMLFVSPIRVRPFVHEQTGVSPQVSAILKSVATVPGINRKELAEKLIGESSGEDAELRKMALASDLRWLVSEGYLIEFNDGSLDLPRVKAKPPETAKPSADSESAGVAAAVSVAEPANDSLVAISKDENAQEVKAIDPIASGKFGEPPLPKDEGRGASAITTPDPEAEIGGS